AAGRLPHLLRDPLPVRAISEDKLRLGAAGGTRDPLHLPGYRPVDASDLFAGVGNEVAEFIILVVVVLVHPCSAVGKRTRRGHDVGTRGVRGGIIDRKSTRLNSSHVKI